MYYKLNEFKINKSLFSRVYRKVMLASKKALLGVIYRIAPELSANIIRASISTAQIPLADLKDLYANKESYTNIIYDFIGQKYMSRWSEEVRGYVWKDKMSQFFEKGVDFIITISDTSVGRGLFVQAFKADFKKVTGQEFDVKKYESDFDYRVKYENVIEKAATKGVRKVEELFNSKAPLSNATLTTFFGKLWKADPTNIFIQWLDYLQSFNRNEIQQIGDSIRRIRYSPDPVDRNMAIRDINAIILSNAWYAYSRTMVSSLFSQLMPLITGEPEDKWLKELIAKRKTWKFFQDQFISSTATLPMGGSTNLYLYFYKLLMRLVETTGLVEEENIDKIKQFMQDEYYVRHIEERGIRNVLTSALPAPTTISDDFFNGTEDIALLLSSIQKNIPDEKKFNAFVEFALLGIKYSKVNFITPTAQRMFNQHKRYINEKYRKGKKKGESMFDSSEFRDIIESMDSYDMGDYDANDLQDAIDAYDF